MADLRQSLVGTLISAGLGLLVLAIVGLILLAPVGLIWALNTLFGLAIPITGKTWAAALVLLALVTPTPGRCRGKE